MKQLVDVLRAARGLVGAGWAQGCGARNKGGQRVSCDSPMATCFCPVGAIFRSSGNTPVNYWTTASTPHLSISSAIAAVEKANNIKSLVPWNDAPNRTQAEVIAAFDVAIAAEEERS
jgi:hypothetical protein